MKTEETWARKTKATLAEENVSLRTECERLSTQLMELVKQRTELNQKISKLEIALSNSRDFDNGILREECSVLRRMLFAIVASTDRTQSISDLIAEADGS